MPKYLITASYTADGARGLHNDSGTGRRDSVAKMLQALGGKLESFYFAFGGADVYAVAELPDAATALAVSMTINASGAVRSTTTPLIGVEEVDQACKKSVAYRAPGA
jgi:uncharacterized protein with GYD domain